jgi:hypothetical protein
MVPEGFKVTYHCFGRSLPEDASPSLRAGFVQARGVNHANLAFHPAVLPHIRHAMLGIESGSRLPVGEVSRLVSA